MKVSVIIPIFNAEKYIGKCLESLLSQTYSNLEIICIDDGSSDKSVDVIKSFNDDRIILFSHKNSGAYLSRKKGFEISSGDYISFIDADDWVDSDYIEVLINNAIANDADVVKMSFVKNFVEENREKNELFPYKKSLLIKKEDFKSMLFPVLVGTYFYNSMCCQIIKRNIISFNNNLDNIIMGEDLLFNLLIIDKSSKFYVLNCNKYHYRYNSESVTTSVSADSIIKKSNDIINVYSELKEYGTKWGFSRSLIQKCDERIIKEYVEQMSYLFFIKKYVNNFLTFKKLFLIEELNKIICSLKREKLFNSNVKFFIKYPYLYYLYKKYVYIFITKLKKLIKYFLGGIE